MKNVSANRLLASLNADMDANSSFSNLEQNLSGLEFQAMLSARAD
jgi:hypothetical protein